MAVTLEVDRYSGTFARVRVVGLDLVAGMPAFAAPVVLATVAGPNGAVIADWTELRDIGGAMWFDDGGTIGKCVKPDGTDETAVQFANWVKYPDPGDWLGVEYDPTTDPGHPRLVVLQHYVTGRPIPPYDVVLGTPPPVEPPPAEEPPAVPLPITGADIANAIGLPGSTPDLDALARTACEWLAPYLDASKITPPDYPGPVREACLVIALDVFQNRTAAGGESVGYDVSAGPYRMGGALWGRVAGLVGPWAAQTSEVG